jgi:amino acid adenylation domain-containing protein
MKSLIDFLSELRSLDIELWLDNGRLRYSAPSGTLNSSILAQLRERKEEIIYFLKPINSEIQEHIQPTPRNEDLSLSFAQQRLWFLDQLEGVNDNYNLFQALQIQGSLNLPALEKAINGIIERHEVLRTNFPIKGEYPLQAIASYELQKIPVIDLQELSEEEQTFQVEKLINQEAQTPFDLTKDILLRSKIICLGEQSHILLLTMHHIASDGGSFSILTKELSSLYEAECLGKPYPLAPLSIQYADFAVWQRKCLTGAVLEKHLTYWKKQLADVTPLLSLPTDYPRPPLQSFQGDTFHFSLDQELELKLRNLSQKEGTTLFITILTAFKILLWYYSSQEDIVVGSPITNRNRPEIEPLIGFFVNNLVLRTKIDANLNFCELLQKVHRTTLEAYEHQDLPFEKLVEELKPERNLSYSPLFQVMLAFNNNEAKTWNLPGLKISPLPINNKTAKFDLILSIRETSQKLLASWEYNTDLFKNSTIERMTEHFQVLLKEFVSNPLQPISQLSLLTATESQQILRDWNQTQSNYVYQPVYKLFEAQAEKTPAQIAVIFQEQKLTYGELNQKVNQLAHYLQKLGVKSETLVGVYVQRSLEMLITLLGILKAGGTYLALDHSYPQQRIAYMLEDSQPFLLLTSKELLSRLPDYHGKIIVWEKDREEIESQSKDNLISEINLSNLAYLIYTSGSTGNPKGVQISHQSLTNLLQSMLMALGLTPKDVLLAITTISFDIAAVELYLSLIIGAKLVIASTEVTLDGQQLQKAIAQHQVTVMQATPTTWQMLIQAGWQSNTETRLKILCTGEALSQQLAQELIGRSEQVWNLYGPTEATIWSTTYHVENLPDNSSSYIPIGRPLANTEIYILNRYLKPLPIGIRGELYIGGKGIARGYLNRKKLTAEKFMNNPYGKGKLYKTGDLAKYLEDGNIEFLGRIDNQVKLRGFRIELGEIEANLNHYPQIKESIVIAKENEQGDKYLVAYLINKDKDNQPKIKELREFLGQKLPDYMIPSAFVFLDQFPLTPNGKIDKRELPEPDFQSSKEEKFIAPRNEIEIKLAKIWQEVLRREKIGINDNFFALGGHSLSATQVVSRIRHIFGTEFPLKYLFEFPTIRELGDRLYDDSLFQAEMSDDDMVTGELSL